jgi:deferrochelatase/peroxidase EfeB
MTASRRFFLASAGGLAAASGLGVSARADAPPDREPFHGAHQGGIVTPQQQNTYFAAFDLLAGKPGEVAALLTDWTRAAERLTAGQTAGPLDGSKIAADAGDALGLSPARLTLTFGFGAGLFSKDGRDRYGLAARRPAALVDLPRFNGDQLEPARTGGDLSVQACADDPQVAFHAVRELSRLAYGRAQLRWAQSGFMANTKPGDTPRNLMGFKDGTNNPRPGDPADFARVAGGHQAAKGTPADFDAAVWVGEEGPGWMRGGSYVVARRIRISLEHWDRTEVSYQEEVVGRRKYSGAPLGGQHERDAPDLDAADADGNPVIPDSAHLRLASPATNQGAMMLRRGYSYNDGLAFTAERWPPWRQGMMYDSGLFFVAWQRDPRTGFIHVFEKMSKLDAMNQFTTHVGGGLFACPGGVAPGAFIGQSLFDTA